MMEERAKRQNCSGPKLQSLSCNLIGAAPSGRNFMHKLLRGHWYLEDRPSALAKLIAVALLPFSLLSRPLLLYWWMLWNHPQQMLGDPSKYLCLLSENQRVGVGANNKPKTAEVWWTAICNFVGGICFWFCACRLVEKDFKAFSNAEAWHSLSFFVLWSIADKFFFVLTMLTMFTMLTVFTMLIDFRVSNSGQCGQCGRCGQAPRCLVNSRPWLECKVPSAPQFVSVVSCLLWFFWF